MEIAFENDKDLFPATTEFSKMIQFMDNFEKDLKHNNEGFHHNDREQEKTLNKRNLMEEKSNPPKRVRFNKPNSVFDPANLPPHHFHLGDRKYAVVSVFAGSARVNLREYERDDEGMVFPTKNGTTLSPPVWATLSREIHRQPVRDDSVLVIENSLMVSTSFIEGVQHVVFQRFFQRKDFSRQFLPQVLLLSEDELRKLEDLKHEITVSIKTLTLDRVLRDLLRHNANKCATSLSPESERVLTDSLTDLLEKYLIRAITGTIECDGCKYGYANQLGHKCMTASNSMLLAQYGDLAVCKMDFHSLTKDFFNKNTQVPLTFISKLDLLAVFKKATNVYADRDQPNWSGL